MPLRKTRIASVKFTQTNESLTINEEQTRRSKFIKDFNLLCPYGSTLTGSTLETQIVSGPLGITLELRMQETMQSNLAVTSTTKTSHAGAADDCHGNDITKLVEEIHQAKQVVRTAINPALSIDDLRQLGPLGDRIRSIRRRLRQRTLLRIPNADGCLVDVYYSSSKFLPRATIVNIKTIVTGLFRNVAELSSAHYIGEVPDALQNVPLPDRILMSRPGKRKAPKLITRLSSAMDAKKPVMLKVAVSFDWVDASPCSLGFIEYLTKTPKAERSPIQKVLGLQSQETAQSADVH